MNKRAKQAIAAAAVFSAALNLTACVYGPPEGNDAYADQPAETQSVIINEADYDNEQTEDI